ncbi:MAG: GPP34 family phosphoprotein [Prolixibacteraceae bacterium]|mgnify:CR=1 FL=1|jgi:hypothetical protein|nr:GPP34 family phosphoprotein [Prolixibacteraceae bacterium]MBT6007278.1 GPP34 family phosphoprotein [Prolixibacteraceae bacterium]MBT6765870.1 GPP34 family phosphoprotein [Prolixibacteraceae bacterium]MBT6997657.1 GPP34 family phosphoprotein [Prolixibacteraceae bacterium]MBT7396725.1 GPP34 family phosphoprotein [Prolixibacteraceae bacterium]
MNDSIPLSEKLYLLGIHPQKGGIISASYTAMDYVLLGTLFLELYLNGNIKFEEKRIIILNKNSKLGLHRFILEKMGKAQKPLKISRWIDKLYFSLKYIRKGVRQNLVDERIIRMQEKRFLFFRWERPVLLQKQVIFNLLTDVEKAVFSGTTIEEEIMMLSFIKPAGLLKRIFPEKEKRKNASQKLKQMLAKNQVSAAVADAIAAAQAVTASVAVLAAATSAATSS